MQRLEYGSIAKGGAEGDWVGVTQCQIKTKKQKEKQCQHEICCTVKMLKMHCAYLLHV